MGAISDTGKGEFRVDIGEEPERSNKPFRIRMTHLGPGAEWTVWVTNSPIALNIVFLI